MDCDMGRNEPMQRAVGAAITNLALLRRSDVRPFLGVTILLAIIYAPIVTYVLEKVTGELGRVVRFTGSVVFLVL